MLGQSNSGCASYFVDYMPTMGCFTSTSVWIMSLNAVCGELCYVQGGGPKHTAIQERILQPLRAFHQVMWIGAGRSERIVFALEQFTLSEDKQLEVTLYEQNGSRTLTFYVEPEDLLLTKKIDNLKLKW